MVLGGLTDILKNRGIKMINIKNLRNEIIKNSEQFKKFLPINNDNVILLAQELSELTTNDILRIFDLLQ
jgi:hypothetical protein